MESLNALEHTILKRVSEKHPAIKSHIPFLRILNREYTGVGMYVNFIYSDEGKSLNPIEPLSDTLSTNERVELPGLKFGLCFVIDITDGKINFIELVTYGEDWDGSILNFSINDI
jgi:hypothetical protein